MTYVFLFFDFVALLRVVFSSDCSNQKHAMTAWLCLLVFLTSHLKKLNVTKSNQVLNKSLGLGWYPAVTRVILTLHISLETT